MIDRILISEQRIGARLDELAREIDAAYAGREILATGAVLSKAGPDDSVELP